MFCRRLTLSLSEGSPRANALVVALLISVIDFCLPWIIMWVGYAERHTNEGARQDAMLFKLLAARYMYTAIVNYMTTPWESTLSEESIFRIVCILAIDALLSPTFNLLDLKGRFDRYVLSRICVRTQKRMNLYFRGTAYPLADR